MIVSTDPGYRTSRVSDNATLWKYCDYLRKHGVPHRVLADDGGKVRLTVWSLGYADIPSLTEFRRRLSKQRKPARYGVRT